MRCQVALVAFALLAAFCCVSGANSTLSLNLGRQYVLGLSSGGFAAVQYHVAFSADVSGAAIFAAGPFFCAQGTIASAFDSCLSTGIPISLDTLQQTMSSLEQSGAIDSLSNLKNSPVWLWHGTSDSTVPASTNDALAQQYKNNGANVLYENTNDSNHAWITPLGPNQCTTSSSPYINNCNNDPEKELLTHLFGKAPNAAVSSPSGSITSLSQDDIAQKLFQNPASTYSMDTTAYLYTPTQCKSQQCDLLVVLHGCEQGYATIGDALIKDAYLNEYADTNNFVVLYPQVITASGTNPEGCWDWWSYLGSSGDSTYVTKNGPQNAIVYALAQSIGFKSTQHKQQHKFQPIATE